jgi:hypothetical protein
LAGPSGERTPPLIGDDVIDPHGSGGAHALQARPVVDVVLHGVEGTGQVIADSAEEG